MLKIQFVFFRKWNQLYMYFKMCPQHQVVYFLDEVFFKKGL